VRKLLYHRLDQQDHPVAVRIRAAPASRRVEPACSRLPFGKGESARQGKRVAVLAFGTAAVPALAGGERLDPPVATCAGPSRSTPQLLLRWQRRTSVLTVEEGAIMGGAGSARFWRRSRRGRDQGPVLSWACGTSSTPHGRPARLLALRGWTGGHRGPRSPRASGELLPAADTSLKIVGLSDSRGARS
jgi:1-deoxy-D-xylulose-5-phosphate synthase